MIKNSVYWIYFARCMNIFNSLLAQLVKYDVHTTRKINSIHAIFITYYHFLSSLPRVEHMVAHESETRSSFDRINVFLIKPSYAAASFFYRSETRITDKRTNIELRFWPGGDHVGSGTWQQRPNQRLHRLLQLDTRRRPTTRCSVTFSLLLLLRFII